MNNKIFAVNLAVPVFVILVIALIAGCFRLKKKESVKGELFDSFVKDWKDGEKDPEAGEKETFFRKFFKLFVQSYEYEQYKESSNKLTYYFYKLLVLFIVLCIPFLVLFLITRKEWILNDSEWNDIYLYTVILVPLIFAYLVNKYIKIRQYREIWFRHLRNRHYLESRMMEFVKDYELKKEGLNPDGKGSTFESLKIDFINDVCGFWKTAASEISVSAGAKEENIFEDMGSLFGK
jgi:hypothetical protein